MTREELIRYGNDYYRDLISACCGVEEKHKEFVRESLKALEQQPCERFEWGIDGNVYKITKAKDGKEICQQVCTDAISRQEVMDALCDECELFHKNGEETCLTKCESYHFLATLPPVTPTISKMEKVEDCISRQAVLELVADYDLSMGQVVKGIHALPPVTPPQKYGKWILADEQNKEDVENDNYRFICSECQCSDIHAKGTIVPYCWKCGAKMQESEEQTE